VERQQKPEGQLISEQEIFELYNKCLDESAPDHQKLTGRLWDKIRLWNKKYFMKETEYSVMDAAKSLELSTEIYDVILDIIKYKANVPKDTGGFISHLKKRLYIMKVKYYHKESASKMPDKLREMKAAVKWQESYKGRKLTKDEFSDLRSKYFTVAEYRELMNLKYADGFEYKFSENNGNEAVFNMLDSVKTSSAFSGAGKFREPEDRYQTIQNASIVREALSNISGTVESLLEKSQKRTRDRYRAFFTLYCLNLTKNYEDVKYYGDLVNVFDDEILEAYKNEGKKPTQSEIYKKYNPKGFSGTQESAESMASAMSDKFFSELSAVFKKKYPEIDLPNP
jgi:hypothetical protein